LPGFTKTLILMNIYLVVIIGYFAIVTLVSVLTRKLASKSASDFLVAGRNLGVISCGVVVAAEWLGGMSTIGVSEKAFTTGTMQPVLYNISTAIGMVIIGFTVARHYREKNVHTVSEMLALLFGQHARIISAIAFMLAYITLAYVQLQTCASVVAPLFGISWLSAVLISSLVITIYTYIGGMHALAVTGMIHVFMMFSGIGIALISGLNQIGGYSVLSAELIALGSPENFYNPFSAGITGALSLIVGGVLGGMAGQASIQPIFAARDVKTARRAAILSAFIVAPFGIMVALLGLMAKAGFFFDPTTITNPKMVLTTLMTTPGFIHPLLGGLALSGILAAILSTVGPVNFAIVTIATKDIYHGLLNKTAPDSKLISTARRLVLLVNIVTVPLAVYVHGAVLDAAYVSYAIRAIGAIVIIMGIYASKWISRHAVYFSFTAGTLAVAISLLAKHQGWFNFDKTLVSVVAAVVFIIVGNWYSRIKTRRLKATN
jgi:solute:Na+ symporter, SSS family